MTRRVVVLGGSGFVGSAVSAAFAEEFQVELVAAPRLVVEKGQQVDHQLVVEVAAKQADLLAALAGADILINAAGIPDASSRDTRLLLAANALLPAVAYRCAAASGVSRFVQISSAVVQGAKPTLDETAEHQTFSPYSESKALAERLLLAETGGPVLVIYRPPSVHAAGRRITRMLTRVARSPLSFVAAPGTQRTPQALLENVAAAVVHLGLVPDPPRIVIHPWEGQTVASLLRLLGGREPRCVPGFLLRGTLALLRWVSLAVPPLRAHGRRLEMLWFGQVQADSWLTASGFTCPAGNDAWEALSRASTQEGAR